jgi:hypothetical protein
MGIIFFKKDSHGIKAVGLGFLFGFDIGSGDVSRFFFDAA